MSGRFWRRAFPSLLLVAAFCCCSHGVGFAVRARQANRRRHVEAGSRHPPWFKATAYWETPHRGRGEKRWRQPILICFRWIGYSG